MPRWVPQALWSTSACYEVHVGSLRGRGKVPPSPAAPPTAGHSDVERRCLRLTVACFLLRPQVVKAAKSLIKFVGKKATESNSLFEEEELLYLQIALKKMPQQPRKDKPMALALPHPIYSSEGQDVCLLVKDAPEGKGGKAAKARLAALDKNGGVAKVLAASKLRTKFESYEAKRKLCASYDLFLADDRLLPALPKLLGKSFFKKKKQPIPVDLRKADWGAQISKALAATYMYPGSGTSVSIRVARSGFEPRAVAENVAAALAAAVGHIPKKWANVQGVFLKTTDSVALPLFQALPDAPQKL
jgi:ribosome biogenesis protein UTP30